MKPILTSLLFLTVAACAKPSDNSTVKSEYPYDMATFVSCQSDGPVRLCRGSQISYALPVLDITYENGVLEPKKLSVFAKINYQNGARQATFAKLDGRGPDDVAFFRLTGGCLVGKLGGCEQAGTAPMRDLLQWAGRSGGALNALDVALAFVDDAGTWDSHYGANYRFHFDQQP